MNIDTKYVLELGNLILRCQKVINNEWEMLSLVYDTDGGHSANSGFLYANEKIRPFSASIEGSPLLVRDSILMFREKIYEETGKYFKQLLIQIEKKTNRIKIDFEFENPERWSMSPSKIKEMREYLRPNFED
jgi:hypothetical protein